MTERGSIVYKRGKKGNINILGVAATPNPVGSGFLNIIESEITTEDPRKSAMFQKQSLPELFVLYASHCL